MTVPVSAETMEGAIRLGKWLNEETLRVYQEHNLGAEARPPIRRFLDKLPEQFKTGEAEDLAEEEDVARRTLFKWLNDLQEAGALEKVRRGIYAKT